ncbi:hypothetical protein D3C80_2032640 [compost metagenome]
MLTGGDAQLARRHADQHGDGMFQLGALPPQVDGLGFGAAQLGQRLADVGFGHDAGVVLVFSEVQRTRIGGHGGIEQALLII